MPQCIFFELPFRRPLLCHFSGSSELAGAVSGACPNHLAHRQTCIIARYICTIPSAFMLSATNTMQYNEHIVLTYFELYAGMCFAAHLS